MHAAAAPGGAEGLTENNESATHDNETSLGWFRAQPPETQALVDLLAPRFDVELHEPSRTGAPWVLDALSR